MDREREGGGGEKHFGFIIHQSPSNIYPQGQRGYEKRAAVAAVYDIPGAQ